MTIKFLLTAIIAGALPALAATDQGQQGKRFFFGKKKQKTSIE